MCGIVGSTGSRQAAPILLEGLKKLEYRGYDSAGIAVMEDGAICVQKVSGRITNEVKGISRVVYDISSKPPATVEWE